MSAGCAKFEEMLPKVLDREALEWEVAALQEHLAGCAPCRELKEELRAVGQAVREPIRRAVAEADFSGFWKAVEGGIEREETAARRRARAGRFVFSGRIFFARLAAAGAVAAALLLAVRSSGAHHDDFALNDNRVDVESFEGGNNDTVILYNSPDEKVTVIWVEPESYQENGPT